MADKVYMQVPAVRQMARSFQQISQVLNNVARVMDALVNILKGTAFVGLVGGYAVAQFIEAIKPHIEKTANHCAELGRDLNFSVDAYERGDALGATRFY